jgi:uncharacterized protein YlxP (DUF503 family)
LKCFSVNFSLLPTLGAANFYEIAMVVGTGIIELFLAESSSLKEKRGILSRILKRTQHEFNISIAEIGANDNWKKALIGFSVVGNDKPHINGKIDHIMNFIGGLRLAEVVDAKFELLSFSVSLSTGSYEEDKYR